MEKIETIRKIFIEQMAKSNGDEFLSNHADEIFSLGLTMYSQYHTIDSIIYNSFATSIINPSIHLHPEQLNILDKIKNTKALIISAPTSFGKTYCIFEYISREKPRNIVLVVPTLALAREYLSSIMSNSNLSNYKKYTGIDDALNYNFESDSNIFILTHDKVVSNLNFNKIIKIDFLVIDEVYKLDKGIGMDDRTLILNVAYYELARKASQYVLLAPFIRGVKNIDELSNKPELYISSFSAVSNKINTIDLNDIDAKNRIEYSIGLLKEMNNSKTLIYLPGPNDINKYLEETTSDKYFKTVHNDEVNGFIEWANKEIGDNWIITKGLKSGFCVHHGQLSAGIKDFFIDVFNDANSGCNKLLCTSTLLEGVNTSTENLIIVSPNRIAMKKIEENVFRAFDFFNLAGRTGRLNKYLVGNVYYLKSKDDPTFIEADAAVSISFELTENTRDIDLVINKGADNLEEIEYIKQIGFTVDEYIECVGMVMRFDSFKNMYSKYLNHKYEIIKYANMRNRLKLLEYICKTISKDKRSLVRYSHVNSVIAGEGRSIKEIITMIRTYDNTTAFDTLVSNIMKIKNGYLENDLLAKSRIIIKFLEKDKENNSEAIRNINELICKPIESLYYTNSPSKRMLKSVGIYDSDIDTIISKIGNDYEDIGELKKRLISHKSDYYNFLSFISKIAVRKFIYDK